MYQIDCDTNATVDDSYYVLLFYGSERDYPSMKTSFFSMLLIIALSIAGIGCAAKNSVVGAETAGAEAPVEVKSGQVVADDATEESSEVDFTRNYSLEIKDEVKSAIAGASSMQDEISRIGKIAEKYAGYSAYAKTQAEKDTAAGWVCDVWDCELNTLCTRIAGIPDDDKREELLTDQKNWNSMKDEVMANNIGGSEDNGSTYPVLESGFMENITQNRCNILANEIAKSRNENFKMPERSIYGTFVDNQGTGRMCSSLITREGKGDDNEAIISIHQMALLDGTFKDKGDGELEFIGNRNNIKGIIKINGWDEATLEITQSNDEIYNVGLNYTFDFAF